MMMHEHEVTTHSLMSWLPAVVIFLLLQVGYLVAVYYLRAAGKQWSVLRTTSFTAGIILCIAALAPPIADYAHSDLRGHMIQHLLLGMLAPIGLVMAAPISLLLRVVPTDYGRKIMSVFKYPWIHILIHPVTAFMLNIGGMYLLYLTPLYASMQSSMAFHFILHVHFMAAGYLFSWSIAGPDPAPNRPSYRLRLLVLFLSMATHAYLSKFMYAYHYPLGTSHSLLELEEAAQWMYYGGDVAEVLLAVALFSAWYKRKWGRSTFTPPWLIITNTAFKQNHSKLL